MPHRCYIVLVYCNYRLNRSCSPTMHEKDKTAAPCLSLRAAPSNGWCCLIWRCRWRPRHGVRSHHSMLCVNRMSLFLLLCLLTSTYYIHEGPLRLSLSVSLSLSLSRLSLSYMHKSKQSHLGLNKGAVSIKL